jgi:hypothetical protein
MAGKGDVDHALGARYDTIGGITGSTDIVDQHGTNHFGRVI